MFSKAEIIANYLENNIASYVANYVASYTNMYLFPESVQADDQLDVVLTHYGQKVHGAVFSRGSRLDESIFSPVALNRK